MNSTDSPEATRLPLDGAANVLAYLERAAERFPGRRALIFGNGGSDDASLTFSQLWQRADRIGSGLESIGFERGERAIVMIPMSFDLYAALFGLLKMGGTAVFVDPWIERRQIAAFSAFAEPSAFLGIGKSHLLRWLEARLRKIPLTVTTGRRLGPLPARRTLREIEARGVPGGRIAPVGEHAPALITFTSGSSGTPKGANRTHGFLAAQHRALAEEFPYRTDDVDMPMFPVFALNNLALGIPSVIPAMDFRKVDEVDAGVLLRQMNRYGVTTATASPPFFDRLVAHLKRTGRQPPALRRILTGGAPVTDRQLERWRQALPRTEITVVYGSTEAEPVAHISATERLAIGERAPARPGFCVGRPGKHVRTRLAPITGRELAGELAPLERHEAGELLVTGEHVCKDYFRNPAAVAKNKWRDSEGTVWHRMGDTGTFDSSGRFWIVGRVHSTIVRDGKTVHPQILEQFVTRSEPTVSRAAAVGLPDPKLGQRVVLVVEAPGPPAQRRALSRRVSRLLQEAGLPADEVRPAMRPLPLDPRHKSKIDYARLRRSLAETDSKGTG